MIELRITKVSSQLVTVDKKFNNYEDFFDFISPHRKDGLFSKKRHEFIFRGHSKSEYKLVPTVFRDNIDLDKYISSDHIWSDMLLHHQKECLVIMNFCKAANQRGLHIPGYHHIESAMRNNEVLLKKIIRLNTWIPDEFLELVVLAQHYGLPTRLLDWTTNVYIAVYFAFKHATKDSDITLWCMNKTAIEIKNHCHKLKFTMPPYHYNDNLNAQKGMLTYWDDHFTPYLESNADDHNLKFSMVSPPVEKRPLDELIECAFVDNKVTVDRGFVPFTKISLPGSEAIKGREVLKIMGFTSSSLFPGYDGVVQEMKFGI
nr:FRG domain-containing protein [Aeromonas veronii]